MSPKELTLISFDVDGTLIHSVGVQSNKLHKAAFAAGVKAVWGIDTHIDVVQHHGATDPLIVIKVMEHHGMKRDEILAKMPEVEAAMNNHFMNASAEDMAAGIEILPGVKDTLEAIKAAGALSCLVTGNLEPIGWAKMTALGIEPLFDHPRFGGFGSDFCSGNVEESWRDRAEFVRTAEKKCLALHPGATLRRFHVGDTPMDILAALDAGAVAIAVDTGVFTREQLEAVAPGKGVIHLSGMANTAAFMKAVGLA
ncbi:hypothetical protein FOA52_014999 [Chlamydomonas sp. UWO 241]|nr:hypothetical protein FOA52_014999 [Chlamydomonas sp. UWO 241]